MTLRFAIRKPQDGFICAQAQHLTRRVGAEGVAKSFHLVRMRLATRRLTSTRLQRKQKTRTLFTSRMSRSRDQVKTSERAALRDHP